MAYPTFTVVNTAINALYDLYAANKPATNGRRMIGLLSLIANDIRAKYTVLEDFTVTDLADATLTAFFASTGALYVALGRPPQVGDVFQVAGTGDTTDNALQAAKGSAVADNDVFIVSNVSTPAVVYLGNTSSPLLTTDNELADFVSLGA
jgi:hypothetical protein